MRLAWLSFDSGVLAYGKVASDVMAAYQCVIGVCKKKGADYSLPRNVGQSKMPKLTDHPY